MSKIEALSDLHSMNICQINYTGTMTLHDSVYLTELIDDIVPGMTRRVLTSNEASVASTEWIILEKVIIRFKSDHSISRPVHLITVVD